MATATKTIEIVQAFLLLEAEIDAAEAALKELKRRYDQTSRDLVEHMVDDGVDCMTCNGRTLYMRTDRFVSKAENVTTEQVCDALESLGYGDLVKPSYSASSLAALVRDLLRNQEQEDEGAKLRPLDERLQEVTPAALLPLVKVCEVTKVVTRSA